MLDARQYSTSSPLAYVEPLQAYLEQPFPRTPQAFLEMEQQLYQTTAQVGDHIVLMQMEAAHDDREFVKQAVEAARQRSHVPLINKGYKTIRVLLLGGSRVVIKTPYLREDHSVKRGRKRRKRGKKGRGLYPVLEALGIRDGVSAATRSEIALYTVQTGSYQEAQALLAKRGLSCDLSTLTRVSLSTAHHASELRDAALESARRLPVALDGPLRGKRVRVSTDGGRVRRRKPRRGRKTAKGRHAFSTPWREPRVIVIDVLDDEGQSDPLRLPLYDVILDDADATFSLIVGYLRLLGAAYAQQVEFISDGADWIWERVDRLVSQAEIPQDRLVLVLDFYHAREHLWEVVSLCKGLSKRACTKWYQKLRHLLRHEPNGAQQVIDELKAAVKRDQGKKMQKALGYFEKHLAHMAYVDFDKMNLPVGSGQVESAVRRVINLRFKAPGSFWKADQVESLMHVRAYFKAGRWDELIKRVIAGEFDRPAFTPDKQQLRKSLKLIKPPQTRRQHQQKKAAA
jgi:hypothetical protein